MSYDLMTYISWNCYWFVYLVVHTSIEICFSKLILITNLDILIFVLRFKLYILYLKTDTYYKKLFLRDSIDGINVVLLHIMLNQHPTLVDVKRIRVFTIHFYLVSSYLWFFTRCISFLVIFWLRVNSFIWFCFKKTVIFMKAYCLFIVIHIWFWHGNKKQIQVYTLYYMYDDGMT